MEESLATEEPNRFGAGLEQIRSDTYHAIAELGPIDSLGLAVT